MADDLHTLSAAYALDALDADDRERFERHLATCEQCRAELAAFGDAAAALAVAVDGPAPPEDLRGRILDAARAEGAPNVVPLRAHRRGATTFRIAAAAASLAIVAFGVWQVTHGSTTSAQSVLQDPAARHYAVPGRGQLVVAPSGVAVLALHLPAPPAGKTYEAWVANPKVHAAGEFDGRVAKLPIRVHRGAQVMVTIERSGGVAAPTSTPLFVVHV